MLLEHIKGVSADCSAFWISMPETVLVSSSIQASSFVDTASWSTTFSS